MTHLVRLGKALDDPTRVRILFALLDSELCVCELVDGLNLSQSTISTHLKWLRNLGIVEVEKRRTWVIYQIESQIEPILKRLFSELSADDPRIRADRERLAMRKMLRVDGCCVVGANGVAREAVLA